MSVQNINAFKNYFLRFIDNFDIYENIGYKTRLTKVKLYLLYFDLIGFARVI